MDERIRQALAEQVFALNGVSALASGVSVPGARSVIFVSGQVSNSPEGQPMHEGDFAGQARLVFENLRTVLEASGASLDNVVKLGVFLMDTSRLPEYGKVKAEFFKGEQPASTTVGVTSLWPLPT